MSNPIVRLFMTEAAIASEIVRSIPLDDRNRDYLNGSRGPEESGAKIAEMDQRGAELAKKYLTKPLLF